MHCDSSFVLALEEKGLLNQITNRALMSDVSSTSKCVGYVGFDPTASSLHIGNLVQIMAMRTFALAGHTPILVIGGGTALVGDPSGRDEMRTMLSVQEIDHNIQKISHILSRLVPGAIIVNNIDWLNSLGYLEVLREYGQCFSVARMLSFDSVKIRLEREQPITFLEFNYMILQAIDFLFLHKNYGCTVQFGGSDQWGNIVSGIDLIRRKTGQETIGITTPLVTKSDGSKMGKSVKGAIWLDPTLCSEYDYWQFWRNVPDSDVFRFMRIYTDLSRNEIDYYAKHQDINEAKIKLADDATRLVHGDSAVDEIHDVISGKTMPKLTYILQDNTTIIDVLCEVKIALTRTEARKLVRGNAVKIDEQAFNDELAILPKRDMIIRVGKNKLIHVKL